MSSPIRFTGLFSGMDTANMVQQLMRAESMRMDRITRRRQTLQWRQDDLRTTIGGLNTFRGSHLDRLTSNRNSVAHTAVWNTNRATVTGANGTPASGVNVTVRADATPGITQMYVYSVAQGAQFRGDVQFRGTGTEASNTANPVVGPGNQTMAHFMNTHGAGFSWSNDVQVTGQQLVEIIHLDPASVPTGDPTFEVHLVYDENGRPVFVTDTDWIAANATDSSGDARTFYGAQSQQMAGITPTSATRTESAGTHMEYRPTVLLLEQVANMVRVPIAVGDPGYPGYQVDADGDPIYVQSSETPYLFVTVQRADGTPVFADDLEWIAANNSDRTFLNAAQQEAEGIEHRTAMRQEEIVTQAAQIEINGTTITVNSHMSLNDFIATVNSQANVTMSFDNLRGVFSIASNTIGEDATITTDNHAIWQAFGLQNLSSDVTSGPRHVQSAQNAVVYFDGNRDTGVSISQASNTFANAIPGVTINLTAGASGAMTINTTVSSDDTIDAIRNFVSEFNDMIRMLNTLHSTPRTRSAGGNHFDPLTDMEREGMTAEEIARWEEQARIGIFHRDEDLRNLHNTLRNAITAPVMLADGTRISLDQIGITTGYGTGSERLIGMLQIDEDRLREALAEDPDRVQALFLNAARNDDGSLMNDRTPADRAARASRSGLVDRLGDVMENFIGTRGNGGTLYRRAGREDGPTAHNNPMSRQLRTYDDRLQTMQRWLQRREAHFFAMFARMEQAMAQSHAQMDALWAFGSM